MIHACAALLGALTWTLAEYCIHRWMGHDRRFRRSRFGREHTRHHAEGDYFAPTSAKLAAAAVAALALGTPAVLVAGGAGLAWTAGLFGCYATYEILHRMAHVHAGIGWYGRWIRRHHFHHHFVDPHTNHGVTSPLWDLVFGTYRRPSVIPVPPRLRMAWLCDPVTGAIHPRHAAHFVLREPAGAR